MIFIHLEHLVVQLWLLTLYFTVSMFALAKMPTVTKMMLEKAAFPTFRNRSKMLKRAFPTFSESLKGVVEKNFPLLFVYPSFLGWLRHWWWGHRGEWIKYK